VGLTEGHMETGERVELSSQSSLVGEIGDPSRQPLHGQLEANRSRHAVPGASQRLVCWLSEQR
jgi:hypothetical protein